MSDSNNVAKASYRSLLRWCKWVGNTPVQITQLELQNFVTLPPHQPVQVTNSTDVQLIAKWAFKQGKHMYGIQAEHAQNNALQSLKFLYNELGQDVRNLKQAKQRHQDRNDINFHVGQVIRHKKFGYKGVVVGWDRKCEKLQWAKIQSVQPNQPFYQIIPDELDCQRLFSGVQHIKYVAQENMINLPFPSYIYHRYLQVYFPYYSVLLGRYLPNLRLQYEYPDNYDVQNKFPLLEQQKSLVGKNNELLMNRDCPEEEDVYVDDWYLRQVEKHIKQEGQLLWQ